MKLNGCQVSIMCDGAAMREYMPAVSKDDEISCWIASRPGKEFWIKYSRSLDCGPQNTDITACVYLDGRRDDTMAWAPFEPSPGDKKVHGEIRGSRLGGKVYYFVFSNPEIIEGATPSSVDLNSIGEIRVKLAFAPATGRGDTDTEDEEPFTEDDESVMEDDECVMEDDKAATEDDESDTKGEEAIVDSSLIRVNEEDKKLGVHCVMLKKSSEVYKAHKTFYCSELRGEDLSFVFLCRSEELLRAEGIMGKRRRQRGEPELVEILEVSPSPKPEPVDEIVPPDEVPADREEVISIASSTPRSRCSTQLSYADEEQAVQDTGETMHPTSQPIHREKRQSTPPDFITLERPPKIPRLSGNSTFAINGGTCESVPIGLRSSRQAPAEGGPRSNVKVEGDLVVKVKVEGDLVVEVKKEDDCPWPEVKKEAGEIKVKIEECPPGPKVKEEVKVEELKDLKAEEKELEVQMAELGRKRDNVRDRMATFRAPGIGSRTRSPRPKAKAERESTRLPLTPEVIDLSD